MCTCAESTLRRRATARLSPSPQRRELLGTRWGNPRAGACAAVCARESSGARQQRARALGCALGSSGTEKKRRETQKRILRHRRLKIRKRCLSVIYVLRQGKVNQDTATSQDASEAYPDGWCLGTRLHVLRHRHVSRHRWLTHVS